MKIILAACIALCGAMSLVAQDSADSLSIPFEQQYPASWYHKSLETSMQVWGDLDMLCNGREDMLPDHCQLVIDSAVGRLVYLDWCLRRLKEETRGRIDPDDISYLVRIVYALGDVYQEALAGDVSGRIESTRPILQSIKENMDYLIDRPQLFNADYAFSAACKQQTSRANLFNPVKSLWYCGCRII